MKRLEQIRPALLRLGQNAESAYMANRPFDITLEFPSLGAALAFRLDFYSTRKFLNNLRDRNKPEVMPFITHLSGLNRLSCARCDREPAIASLRDFGYVPLHFRLAYGLSATDNIDAQLTALGLEDIPTDLNVNTMRNADFAALAGASNASATPSPSFSPSGQMHTPSAPTELPISPSSTPSLPLSMTLSYPPLSVSETFSYTDVTSPRLHDILHKLSVALLDFSTAPSTISQANVRRHRRALLDSPPSAISDTLRTFLMGCPIFDDIFATADLPLR